MISKVLAIIIVLITVVTILLIFYTYDSHLTDKRIAINQQEWNKFSKNMSRAEKLKCFRPFLISQKEKYGWRFLYIPYIFDGEVKADEGSDCMD